MYAVVRFNQQGHGEFYINCVYAMLQHQEVVSRRTYDEAIG